MNTTASTDYRLLSSPQSLFFAITSSSAVLGIAMAVATTTISLKDDATVAAKSPSEDTSATHIKAASDTWLEIGQLVSSTNSAPPTLAQRLMVIRKKAIADGMRLLSIDEIDADVQRLRRTQQ